MRCRMRPLARRRRRTSRDGFTIVELAIVLVIISIIASIAMANFIKFRLRATYTSCVSNQRHILEASTLYIAANSPGTSVIDVNVLTGGAYVAQKVAGCPASTVRALDDYTIHIVDNDVAAIDCKIEPANHQWNVP